ncbi:hypothetical protein QJS10_CPB11g01453 [Acorus calamus]|uniref:Borealin C-terminal domain-containing protein n=1 Tax=Acorus calamus TaxID=4465 RepID=A0AAV9DV76_ACOCL|nr:hypothetical protein QJS10_CPB11g01453 [Acorus calamus]
MVNKRGKKNKIVNGSPSPLPETQTDGAAAEVDEFSNREVERRILALRATLDSEIERLLTELRLLRWCINEEQLKTPVLQYFKDNLPNMRLINNEDGEYEPVWKIADGTSDHDGESNMPGQLTCMKQTDSAVQMTGGLQFSVSAIKANILGATGLYFSDLANEQSETLMPMMQSSLKTPGVTGQRLSIGMTPKTLRLPKHGEMLLSVHGSPLGVYKEEILESINEFEEG